MQYLILLSALMSLATVVMAQDVEPAVDDSSEALSIDGPGYGESVSAAVMGIDELEEIY